MTARPPGGLGAPPPPPARDGEHPPLSSLTSIPPRQLRPAAAAVFEEPRRSRWFLSVHLNQLLGYLTALSLTVLAAAWIVSSAGRDRVLELSQHQLEREAEVIARAARHRVAVSRDEAPIDWRREAAVFGGMTPEHPFVRHVAFYSREGALLGASQDAPVSAHSPPEIEAALGRGRGHALRLAPGREGEREFLFVAVPTQLDAADAPAFVAIGRSTEAWRATIDELTFAILFGAALALLASVVTALLSARLLSKPIAEMSTLAQNMAAGAPLRIDSSRQDELGILAASINYLSDQLTARIDQAHNDKMLLLTILDGMAEGVIVADTQGRVVLVNPAAVKLLHLGERTDVEGRPVHDVATPTLLAEAMNEAIRQDHPINRELTLDRPERVHLAVAAAPTHEGGRVTGAVAVLHDITRLRMLERVRRDFVANVSHELRTPIATITGYAETLLSGPLDLDPMTREFVEAIERNGRRITDLVQDLLILARLEAQGEGPPLAPIHASAAVADVLDALDHTAEAARVTLVVDMDDLPPVMAEQRALTQILRNLIENAIKYTDPGGCVTLKAHAEGDHIIFQILDTGIGIDAVHLPRIFERFYRVDEGRSRDRGGTGLGLAIVKHMVQAMHGEVAVQSHPGAGTTFTIKLPIADEAAP